MSRVLSIAVALSAALFVAYAYPQPQEEATTGAAEGSTTQNPMCAQYEAQCGTGQGGMAPIQGGIGAMPGIGSQINQTQGQMPMNCQQLKDACAQGGGAGATPPPGAPAPPAAPAPPGMNGTMPEGGMPGMNGTMPAAEIPGVGGMNNLTSMPAIPGMPGRR